MYYYYEVQKNKTHFSHSSRMLQTLNLTQFESNWTTTKPILYDYVDLATKTALRDLISVYSWFYKIKSLTYATQRKGQSILVWRLN